MTKNTVQQSSDVRAHVWNWSKKKYKDNLPSNYPVPAILYTIEWYQYPKTMGCELFEDTQAGCWKMVRSWYANGLGWNG